LDGLYIVSADIVEVAPAYDTNAELTTMAAADVSVCLFIYLFDGACEKSAECRCYLDISHHD
jgi:Arginase family